MDPTLTILGVFLPLVLAVVNRHAWPAEAKGIVALGVCLLVSVGVMMGTGQELTLEGVFASLMNTYGTAQATFHLGWNPSGAAEAIESRTG